MTSAARAPARLHQAFHREQHPYPSFLLLLIFWCRSRALGCEGRELGQSRRSRCCPLRFVPANRLRTAQHEHKPSPFYRTLEYGSFFMRNFPSLAAVSEAPESRQVNVRPGSRIAFPRKGSGCADSFKLIRITHSAPWAHNSTHTVWLAHLCNLYCTQHPKTRGGLV